MEQKQSSPTDNMRWVALFSNLGLLTWVGLWHGYLSPHPHLNPLSVTIAWMLPLLLPLRGVLAGKAFTHAWANFILMFYFLHALTILWVDEGELWLALVELLLVTGAFVSNIFFARWKGKEDGIGLKRLSQVEKEERARFEINEEEK